MYSIKIDNLDLGQIAASGQCFRMNYVGKGTYSIIAFGKYLEVSQSLDTLIFSCDETEYEEIWKEYFDIETDYAAIKSNTDISDEFLQKAIQYGSGIRILKQDIWEMLVTFIISQRKSIPAIKKCVETLCQKYGEQIMSDSLNDDKPVIDYAFPTPKRIAELSIEELRACGLGYRDVYVAGAASWFIEKYPIYQRQMKTYTVAKSLLMKINGVGTKVSNCICLFALHQLEACPIDVWMQKIIDDNYRGIMPSWMVSDKAGVLQQYAFYYKKSTGIYK